MKLLLSLCVVICAASFCSAANPDDMEACSREANVDLKAMKDVKVTDKYSLPEDVKNFAACVYKKDGIMNQDGSLNSNFAKGPIGEFCKISNAGKDLAENVAKLMKCFDKERLDFAARN